MLKRAITALSFLTLASCATLPPETAATTQASGAARLLTVLDSEAGPEQNVFFSPLSIDHAFGIVALGARDETAAQLASILPPPASPKSYTRDRDGVEVRLSNRLWIDEQFNPAQEFIRAAEQRYDAGIEQIDKTQPGASAQRINEWAKEATDGLIPQVVSARDITPDLALFVTNALFFDGEWENEFDSYGQEPFLFGDGIERPFTLMKERMMLRTADHRGLRAVRLPYRDNRYVMDVIMPSMREVMDRAPSIATIDDFGRRLANAEPALVAMKLPRFEIDTDFDLKSPLRALGLTLPFDKNLADLTGIAEGGNPRVFVSKAKQLAKLQVFDTGTRAAAVTVLKIIPTASRIEREEAIEFTVDRPFVIVIRDLDTGATLFLGRIANPEAYEPEVDDSQLRN